MHEHEVKKNALSRGDVLLVATSAASLPNGSQTGLWLSELAVPYVQLTKSGFSVTIASPNGGEIPVDPVSLKAPMGDDDKACVSQFNDDENAKQMMTHSVALSSVESIVPYSGIFMAGGHGAVMDFPDNAALQKLVTEALQKGVAVAALCHGNGVFANDALGKMVKGKRLSVFTDEEERGVGKEKDVPFLLETKMRQLGADIVKGTPGGESVVVDGRLATGANPASAMKLSKEFITLMDTNYPAH